MTFDQRERAIGMLTTGMWATDIAQHFQRHESTISRLLNRFKQTGMWRRDIARHFQRYELTISRLLNRFQQTGNVADQPRSGRPRKNHALEDRFLTTLPRLNRFLPSRRLGHLLRNGTGTRVCDSTGQSGIGYTPLD